MSREFVEELRRERSEDEIIYVNDRNSYGTYGNMSDQNIISLGYKLDAVICTCNIRHFAPYYDKLIPLKSRKSTKKLIEETRKYLSP